MKENGVVGNSVDQCEAVSEIIGVVLMISLAVIGVGIVSVIVIGQDTPVEVPSLTMIPASGETDLFLYHTGGDSLKRGEFVVRVDGVDYSADNINIIDQGGNIQSDWDSWDLGESLMIEGKSDYNQILILSVRGGGATVIAGSGEAAITPTSTATATETATPVPGPNAEFSADSTSGYVPFTVTFTDLSTNTPTFWSWSFGDGNTSGSPDPVYTYYSPGTYDVSLTVSNAGGSDTETKTGYINVTGTPSAPVANFTADATSGTAPLDVTFTDLSTGTPTSWSWDFGDGGNSTAQNPVYTYSSPGTYTVTLNATNAGGSDAEVKTDYITVTPSLTPAAWWKFDETSGTAAADSSGNNNNGVIYGSVLHDPAGACDGALYFDGTSTYVLVPDSNTLDAPAYLTYTAWLRPEPPEPVGFDNYTSLICKGRDDRDNYELFISRYGSDSEFTFETNDNNNNFRDYTTNDFNYEYGEWQHIAFVADTDSRTAKLYVNGNYAATLSSNIVTSMKTNNRDLTLGRQQYNNYNLYYRGLMDDVMLFTTALTDEQISEIYGTCTPSYPPDADFSADVTSGDAQLTVSFTDLSANDPTSWSWNFGDGETSTQENPVHVYEDPGTYTVSLTATNGYGSDSEQKTDYITVTLSCDGLVGTYYDTVYYSGDSSTRSDSRLRFADDSAESQYGYDSDISDWPDPVIGKTDSFSVIYEGYIEIETPGYYTFYLTSDDGSYLWIDDIDDSDTPVVDNGGYHSPRERSGTIYLTEGYHPVKVKMFENTGAAVLYLEWESSGVSREFVESFAHEGPC